MSARNGSQHKLRTIGIALARCLQERPTQLRYVSALRQGILRRKCGSGFAYFYSDGRKVSTQDLGRIRALALPPAWRDVMICPRADGHLQAVGWDAKGRKQYRYHSQWRAGRDAAKYGKLRQFGDRLSGIRRQVERDLARHGLCRDKILATVVRLLDTTLIRVGNEVYARENGSFGLTTMRDRHVSIEGSTVLFSFKGKSGIHHQVELDDRHLAQIIRQSRDLPGYELFQYLDEEGQPRSVRASDVNEYLKRVGGEDLTAKDFRTWAGTVLAIRFLLASPPPVSRADAKRHVLRAIESVAERLRNTKTVCRNCYIHPLVLEAYLSGRLLNGRLKTHARRKSRYLCGEERLVLRLLSTRPSMRLRQAA